MTPANLADDPPYFVEEHDRILICPRGMPEYRTRFRVLILILLQVILRANDPRTGYLAAEQHTRADLVRGQLSGRVTQHLIALHDPAGLDVPDSQDPSCFPDLIGLPGDRDRRSIPFGRREREADLLLAEDDVCFAVPGVSVVVPKLLLRCAEIGQRILREGIPHHPHCGSKILLLVKRGRSFMDSGAGVRSG